MSKTLCVVEFPISSWLHLDVTVTRSTLIDSKPSPSIPVISCCHSDSIDHVTTGEGQRGDRSDHLKLQLWFSFASYKVLKWVRLWEMLVGFQCVYKKNLYLKKWAFCCLLIIINSVGAGCCLSSCTPAVSSRASELCEYVRLLFPFWTESLVNHFGSDEFRIKKTSTKMLQLNLQWQWGEKNQKQPSVWAQLLTSYAAPLVVVFISWWQKHSFRPFSGFR